MRHVHLRRINDIALSPATLKHQTVKVSGKNKLRYISHGTLFIVVYARTFACRRLTVFTLSHNTPPKQH